MDAFDKTDRAILRSLQADGRAAYEQVAERGAAPREKARGGLGDRPLCRAGRSEAVGLGLAAYLNVRLEKHTESHRRSPMDLLRASVQAWPEVVECAALSGEMGYLLQLVVRDMDAYARFIMDTLLKHPSVQDCKISFVFDRVKSMTAVPV